LGVVYLFNVTTRIYSKRHNNVPGTKLIQAVISTEES
jgi:hypothetical protein